MIRRKIYLFPENTISKLIIFYVTGSKSKSHRFQFKRVSTEPSSYNTHHIFFINCKNKTFYGIIAYIHNTYWS